MQESRGFELPAKRIANTLTILEVEGQTDLILRCENLVFSGFITINCVYYVFQSFSNIVLKGPFSDNMYHPSN